MNLGFHCHHCGIGHFAAPTRLSQGVRWEKRDKASGKKLRKQTACFESSVTMRAEIGAFGQFGHIHFHRGRCLCNVGIDMHLRTLHVLDCFRVSFCSHILRQHTAVSLLFHGFPGDLGGLGDRGVLFNAQNYSHLDTVGMEFPVERSVAGALEGALHVCGCEQVGKFWRDVCKLHGNVQCHVLGFSFLSRCFG